MDNYNLEGRSVGDNKTYYSMQLEKDFLSNDMVNLSALKNKAEPLPKALNEAEFKAQFTNFKGKNAIVKTPIGNVSVDIDRAWNHLTENTYLKDRREFSGAFFETLTNPLFVVRQDYHRVSQAAQSPHNAKTQKQGGNLNYESDIIDSYTFFKPYTKMVICIIWYLILLAKMES